MPFGQQAIGSQTAMQRAAGDAVEIRQICSGNGPESIEIEVGIAKFERIESPADEANIPAECFVSLEKFQHSADAAVAIVGMDPSHVRVQIRNAVADGGDRQREARQALAIEDAEHLAAGIGRHHKRSGRLDFKIRFLPNFALQRYATMKFVERLALANDDATGHLPLDALMREGCGFAFCDSPLVDFRALALFFSPCFTASHNDSLSSRGMPSKLRSLCRASFSISMKRR